jgi:hypothetical protein
MTKRPLKFKLDAFRMYCYYNMTPIEAFAAASKLNNDIPLSGCMTTKAYASGYMSDDIKNVLRTKIIQGNTEVLEYFLLWNMRTVI